MGRATWILTYQGLSGYWISACPAHLIQKQIMNLSYDCSIKELTSCLFVSLLLSSPIFCVWVCVFYLESLNWPPLSRDLCAWVLSCFSHVHGPPISSVHGILQARILEWVAMLFSIFPTQGSNLHLLCLLHWQACSLLLSPPGKPIQRPLKCIFLRCGISHKGILFLQK